MVLDFLLRRRIQMKSINNKSFYLGLLFTLIITVISLLCAQLPLLNNVGALSIAILIAIAYRHFKGYPETYRSGIAFSSKRLLKSNKHSEPLCFIAIYLHCVNNYNIIPSLSILYLE